MSRIDRGVASEINTAIGRATDEALLLLPWTARSPVILINWPVAGERGVPHRLGAKPTGYVVLAQTGAVYAARFFQWTENIAWLTAPTVGTAAYVCFVTVREPVLEDAL